jgi:hypothetical protein
MYVSSLKYWSILISFFYFTSAQATNPFASLLCALSFGDFCSQETAAPIGEHAEESLPKSESSHSNPSDLDANEENLCNRVNKNDKEKKIPYTISCNLVLKFDENYPRQCSVEIETNGVVKSDFHESVYNGKKFSKISSIVVNLGKPPGCLESVQYYFKFNPDPSPSKTQCIFWKIGCHEVPNYAPEGDGATVQ